MSDLKSSMNALDVPYYNQTRFYTCGPAALMMVMKYWDNTIELSRKTEYKLWMMSNPFVFFGGTLQFGLAKTAVHIGFKAKIYQKARFSEYHKKNPRLFNFIENIISLGARHAKVPVYYGEDVLDMIQEALYNGIPPLVFLNLDPIIGENVFHWLVVTGLDEKKVYVNDPYIPYGSMLEKKKDHPIDLGIFKKAISTDSGKRMRLPPCAIFVYR